MRQFWNLLKAISKGKPHVFERWSDFIIIIIIFDWVQILIQTCLCLWSSEKQDWHLSCSTCFHVSFMDAFRKQFLIHCNHPAHSLSSSTFLWTIACAWEHVYRISNGNANSGDRVPQLSITFCIGGFSIARSVMLWNFSKSLSENPSSTMCLMTTCNFVKDGI